MSDPPTNVPSGFPLPGDPPPDTRYYGQSLPRPAGSSSGCLKAFGITCLSLLVLGILGVLLLFPTVRGVFQTVRQAASASQDGENIRQAILAYHQKNGAYPPSLISLVTDGESDGRDFHSSLDADPDPSHISWTYTPPAKNAPGSTPILDLPYQVTVLGHTAPGHLIVDLDGGSPKPGDASKSP